MARTARPGEPGADEEDDVFMRRRAVEGCEDLRALSPSARLTLLLTTFMAVPPRGPAPILGGCWAAAPVSRWLFWARPL